MESFIAFMRALLPELELKGVEMTGLRPLGASWNASGSELPTPLKGCVDLAAKPREVELCNRPSALNSLEINLPVLSRPGRSEPKHKDTSTRVQD